MHSSNNFEQRVIVSRRRNKNSPATSTRSEGNTKIDRVVVNKEASSTQSFLQPGQPFLDKERLFDIRMER